MQFAKLAFVKMFIISRVKMHRLYEDYSESNIRRAVNKTSIKKRKNYYIQKILKY